MKRWLILLLLSSQVIADSNSMSFSIPSISSVSGSDSIRAGDLDCKNAIGGSTNFEIGMTGVINNAVVPIIGKEGNDPQTWKYVGLKLKRPVKDSVLSEIPLRFIGAKVATTEIGIESVRIPMATP